MPATIIWACARRLGTASYKKFNDCKYKKLEEAGKDFE